MCLAIVALNAHPRYRLVVAANRDEYHARDADAAKWWDEGILAGRDRVGHGTWLGITRQGRWALLTNFREGTPRDPAAPSRGGIVTDALCGTLPPLAHAAAVASDGVRFHGFNLLVGDGSEVAYASNRASGAVRLPAGVHGLSNHLLDTPSPKLRRAQTALEPWLNANDEGTDQIFAMLADRTPAKPEHLPSTGVSTQWEQMLSSIFIVTPDYGTRCSTVLTITHGGEVQFAERSFDALGKRTGDATHSFATSRSTATL